MFISLRSEEVKEYSGASGRDASYKTFMLSGVSPCLYNSSTSRDAAIASPEPR